MALELLHRCHLPSYWVNLFHISLVGRCTGDLIIALKTWKSQIFMSPLRKSSIIRVVRLWILSVRLLKTWIESNGKEKNVVKGNQLLTSLIKYLAQKLSKLDKDSRDI